MAETEHYQGADVAINEVEHELQPPTLYKVIIQNDDYTPMDFVVHILEAFFTMNTEDAIRVMLEVHHNGQGICGIFSKQIAETKVHHINNYSKQNQHPLLCIMERE